MFSNVRQMKRIASTLASKPASSHYLGTIDYVKRVGQSVGLALWLWVHRPANCYNIATLQAYQQQLPEPFGTDDSTAPLDSLPDSLWLKHFVLGTPQERLPPIARAMKNMLDHDALIWNSNSEEPTAWPHYINEVRMANNKDSRRRLAVSKREQLTIPVAHRAQSRTSEREQRRLVNISTPVVPKKITVPTSTVNPSPKVPTPVQSSPKKKIKLPIKRRAKRIKRKGAPMKITLTSVAIDPVFDILIVSFRSRQFEATTIKVASKNTIRTIEIPWSQVKTPI